MAGEEWARRVVQKELGYTVEKHDDGSASGMYDLRIGPPEAPQVAIECVAAVDSIFTETWNVGPAKGPFTLAVEGDWTIVIGPTSRVKVVKQHLTRLLKELEARGIYNLNVNDWFKWDNMSLFDDIKSLGITRASCYRVQGSGQVHLSMPGHGGAVDEKGSSVPKWLGDFLRDPARKDVLSKLERSTVPNRHVFVIATLTIDYDLR